MSYPASAVDRAVRIVALMNQKGGVGKTTTAVNLGAALAEADRRVCLIDLDPQAHPTYATPATKLSNGFVGNEAL